MKYLLVIILLLAYMQEGQAQTPVASYKFDTNLEDQNGDNFLTPGGQDTPSIMMDGGRSYLDFTGDG